MFIQMSVAKNFLLDLIFPRVCLGCQKELNLKQASLICEACLSKIPLNGVKCHVCGLRNSGGTCRLCRKKTFLKGVYCAGKYENPILREAIHKFKYQGIESLKKPLAELLINYLNKENLVEKFHSVQDSTTLSILTPIPLNWRRKLSRGFNQSELLTKELSPVLNCPVINLLKRKKFSEPQAKIKDWKQRKENIFGAFSLNYKLLESIKSPKIILVDDVTTSGSTLEEAAKVLKEAGIKEVYGLAVAKG